MSDAAPVKERPELPPLKIPERIPPARQPRIEERAPAAVPVWIWVMVGGIVLIALGLGGAAGFIAGRQYEQHLYSVTLEPIIPILPPESIGGGYEDTRIGVYYRMLKPTDPFSVSDGALIITAWPGGPAELAGLEAGDIIIAVNDQSLSQSFRLGDALNDYPPGAAVRLRILDTDGVLQTLRAQLDG